MWHSQLMMQRYKIGARCFIIAMTSVILGGCTVHSHQTAPTPAIVKRVGLPVYPHARPYIAHVVDQSSRIGTADVTSIDLITKDDLPRVEAFYAARVPKNAQKIVVPLGITTTTAYQWYERDSQKQVLFERIKDMTVIHLQSMKIGFPNSQTSASPSTS
jgi:hypothetical protein